MEGGGEVRGLCQAQERVGGQGTVEVAVGGEED